VLAHPRRDGEFILDCDASLSSVGAVLHQIQEGEERVIAYYSRCLDKCERNYCATRRELLAVINSVQHFRMFLTGRSFKIRSDHASLQWLERFKEAEGQMARWQEKLQ